MIGLLDCYRILTFIISFKINIIVHKTPFHSSAYFLRLDFYKWNYWAKGYGHL